MTKCLYLMGRCETNLICISINLMKTFEKNEKITEKSRGHTYKNAHISFGINLRLLNVAYN